MKRIIIIGILAAIVVAYMVTTSFALTVSGHYDNMGAGDGANDFQAHLVYLGGVMVAGTGYATIIPVGSYSGTTYNCGLQNGRWVSTDGTECTALEGDTNNVKNAFAFFQAAHSGDIRPARSADDQNCFQNSECYVK